MIFDYVVELLSGQRHDEYVVVWTMEQLICLLYNVFNVRPLGSIVSPVLIPCPRVRGLRARIIFGFGARTAPTAGRGVQPGGMAAQRHPKVDGKPVEKSRLDSVENRV